MNRNLALFDLDHTLPLDSDQAWAHFIAKLGVEDAVRHAQEIDAYYRQYVAGTLDMNDYLNYTLAPLARHSRAQLDAWHAAFMSEVIARAIRPAPRATSTACRCRRPVLHRDRDERVGTAPIGKAAGIRASAGHRTGY